MDFITCGQMKILEKRADEAGLSYYQMMENAGSAAADTIISLYPSPISNSRTLIFCGKGNNGGDGFVVARKFMEQGGTVAVILVDGPPVTVEAQKNFELIKANAQIIDMSESASPFMQIKGSYDIIVDAVYGTGFHGMLNPNALKSTALINQLFDEALVFALDIPSGLGGDVLSLSEIDPNAVKAQYTIVFHNRKPVHIQNFSKTYCGELTIVDIGIKEDELW